MYYTSSIFLSFTHIFRIIPNIKDEYVRLKNAKGEEGIIIG